MHEEKSFHGGIMWEFLTALHGDWIYKLILTTSDMTTFCILAYIPWSYMTRAVYFKIHFEAPFA